MITITVIAVFMIFVLLILEIRRLEKKICGLCAEHNKWAKDKPKGTCVCDCYGCIYEM